MDFGQILAEYGLVGLTTFVLAGVVVKLYNANEKLRLRIEELQDLRLEDSKQLTKDVTTVMQDSSQNMRVLSEKIEIAKGQRE